MPKHHSPQMEQEKMYFPSINILSAYLVNCLNPDKQKGSNGITKAPLYMGRRRGFTPYKNLLMKKLSIENSNA
jgi:hypothetical protein